MLNDIGEKILSLKYAREGEDWTKLCLRVASYVALAEKEEEQLGITEEFFRVMYHKAFIPGGRILANSGTGILNLMNCFVLPLDDSRTSIYETLGNSAEIFAHGGGIGYNFSKLRERGAEIKGTGGKSTGPLSFMELFDTTGEVIQQASRRGAQMGMMSVRHPDILNFIRFKAQLNERNERILFELAPESSGHEASYRRVLSDNQLTHFNISVIIPDDFMFAVQEDKSWDLISPSTGEVVETIKARTIFDALCENAWESGDPGVFFIDRAEEDNMVGYLGEITATNPCGEVPLLPYEACCLGSLNLHEFYDADRDLGMGFSNTVGGINWEKLEYVVRLSTRFLDNVQTLSETPIDIINETCKNLRRLGLGVMGWADLLAELELPYNSPEANELAEKISWFISFFSWSESLIFGEERSPFKGFDKDLVNQEVIYKIINSKYSSREVVPEPLPVRNISVTSIAPTGSIALLAGVNSSIEPFYALSYRRNITSGVGNTAKDYVIEVNSILFKKLNEYGLSKKEIGEIREHLVRNGTLETAPHVPEHLKKVFVTAHEINWEDHVKTQASWQKYVTNAVSKTINMKNSSTVEDIKNAYILMWESGLKGGTIYRDGSKSFQILNTP